LLGAIASSSSSKKSAFDAEVKDTDAAKPSSEHASAVPAEAGYERVIELD
jgi:hypothetical protein